MEFVRRLADLYRSRFDSHSRRMGPVGVVGVLAIVTAGIFGLMRWLERWRCGDSRVSIIDLELTFSSTRFDTLLRLIEREECRAAVRWHFVPLDALFAIAYGTGLCAAFLWMERQRRFNADDTPTNDELPRRNHFFVVVPLAAALFDIIAENVPLWFAATILRGPWKPESPLIAALVWIGSLGAAIKWTLVLTSILALVAEAVSCSRGAVLRRLRFSAFAVVVGGFALLVVPQGQDILQRVAEDSQPLARMLEALLALTIAALAVWYCGRKLVQFRFRGDPDPEDGNWYQFYARQIPRQLGIAVLVAGGAAFARAGAAGWWFVLAAFVGYAAVYAAERWGKDLPRKIGRNLVFGAWRMIDGLDRQIGNAVIGGIITGAVILLVPAIFEPWPAREFMLLRITAWLLLVVAWLFYLYVYFRRGRVAALRTLNAPKRYEFELKAVAAEAVASVDADRPGRGIRRGVLAGFAASAIAVAVFTFWPVGSARALGSLMILALAVSSVVFFGSIAAWVYGRFRIPVVPTAIAFAVLFSVWNENHVVRTLDTGRELVASRPDIAKRLAQWQRQAGGDSTAPIILVAASGGGLRAAYWTATSLAALRYRNPGFEGRLFAISSVSGGSLGAVLYAAIARDSAAGDAPLECRAGEQLVSSSPADFGLLHRCIRGFMGHDFLSPLLAKMVAPDFLQLLFPIPIRAFDRSLALEKSWEESYSATVERASMSEGFLALTRDTTPGVPALFLNSTHVETGKRYVTASLVRNDTTLEHSRDSSRAMLDSRDLLDILQSDMTLASAAHNSARFPYVSPPGRVQRNDSAEFGHVVDGGYFENSGLATLREVLDVLKTRTAGGGSLRPIVIYLCNDPVACSDSALADTIVTAKRGAMVEWAGPIRALLATRNARGSLSRADIRHTFKRDFYQLNVCESLFATASAAQDTSGLLEGQQRRERAKERLVSPPLGWLLSRAAQDWMDASLTLAGDGAAASACRRKNVEAIESIRRLISGPVSPAQPTAGARAATGTAPAESGAPAAPLLR